MNELNQEKENLTETLTESDMENLQKAFENLYTFANEISKAVRRGVEVIEEIARKNAPVIAAIVKNLNEIPNDFLAIQQTLSERGWFVLSEMPASDFRNLKKLIDASEFDELDDIMSAWTLHLFDETERKLCDLFPDRESLIKEGFDNHREGRYASAITLLLTQADGICFDILEEIFFKINRATNVPAVKDKIDALGIDAFTEITLHPILVKAGINASDKQINNGEFPDSPHRHPILHGRATDYPSELNSLKVISFVGYLGGVVYEIVEKAKKTV